MKRKNDSIYKISGPMGLGLGVKTEGVHIAFAAGTGVLAFMDLVALIVRQSHFQRVYEDGLGDSFKLVMFHRRRDNEPIGHEFLKAANEKCDKFDYYLNNSHNTYLSSFQSRNTEVIGDHRTPEGTQFIMD